MAQTQLFKMPFGFSSTAPVVPVWPRYASNPPVRHPSRNKLRYRPRGTTALTVVSLRDAKAPKFVKNHQAAWQAQTATAARARRKTVVIWAGMAVASVAILSGGYAIVPQTTPTGEFAASDLLTTAPAMETVPQAPAPRAPVVAAAIDKGLQLPAPPSLSPQEPRVMTQAPLAPPTPTPTQVPTLDRQPNIIATASAPAALFTQSQDDPFVCAFCASAFPQFGQVSFDVQTTDTNAPQVQNLMRNLDQYQSNLRLSAIPVTNNQVRFYRTEDAQAAGALAALYNAELVDLTWFAPTADIAKIDVLLAAKDTTAAAQNGL